MLILLEIYLRYLHCIFRYDVISRAASTSLEGRYISLTKYHAQLYKCIRAQHHIISVETGMPTIIDDGANAMRLKADADISMKYFDAPSFFELLQRRYSNAPALDLNFRIYLRRNLITAPHSNNNHDYDRARRGRQAII